MSSFICFPQRTPVGSFMGSLSSFTAPQLGAEVLRAVCAGARLSPEEIDEVYMGCVLSAGLGQAPARQAALGAGVHNRTPCTTLGKVCGSGLKAVMLADLTVRANEGEAILAGGMESMSNAPYLLPKARQGLRMGPGELVDSMVKDGLWDVYNDYHMGTAAELCVREHKISREDQDAHALESYRRAVDSQKRGLFKDEIVALKIAGRKGETVVSEDEEPGKLDASRVPGLKAVFDKAGTITAANASSLNDGAAGMLICSEKFAGARGLKPMARIVAQAQSAQDPAWFTTAPAASIKLALGKAKLSTQDIDAWEINEAFSAVAIVNARLLELDPARVNPRGGSVAMGHPIGASGARILTTLVHGLAQNRQRYGVASLCIGGGEAVTVVVENLVR